MEISRLSRAYYDFIESHPSLNNPASVDEATRLLLQLRRAGRREGDPRQREVFAAWCRELADAIYQATGEYPAVRIAPFEGAAPVEGTAPAKGAMARRLSALTTVLSQRLGALLGMPGLLRSAPRSLPGRVMDYIARHDERGQDILRQIVRLLARGTFVTIWGASGVGKTTLAVEAATSMLRGLPGGVVWVDAGGRASFDLSVLLDEVFTQLGKPAHAALPNLDRSYSIARALLGERRRLLVLDGFEGVREQEQGAILLFLERAPCAVLLITTRYISRGENVHLGPMTAQEARQLLDRLVKRSPRRAKLERLDLGRITDVAEGNPMAMRWLLRQLEVAARPQDVFDELPNGMGEAARRILARSFALLDEDGQMLLQALCLFASKASTDALAAVCAFDEHRVVVAVQQLALLDLLVSDGERVGVGELIRHLVPIPDDFAATANLRLIQYYQHLSKRIDYYRDPSGLDAEYENVMKLVDWCSRSGRPKELLALFAVVGEFVTDRSGYQAREKLGRIVLSAAKDVGDDKAYAWYAVYTVAWPQLREGMVDQAEPLILESLHTAEARGYKDVIALSKRSLALVAKARGDRLQACRLFGDSLALWEQLGDVRWAAMLKMYLAEMEYEEGDYQSAEALAQAAEQGFSSLRNEEGMAWASCTLGEILHARHRILGARRKFAESLAHREKMRAPAGLAHTAMAWARLEKDAGRPREALQLAERAHQIYSQLGTLTWEPEAEGLLAEIRQELTLIRRLRHFKEEAGRWVRNWPCLVVRKLSGHSTSTDGQSSPPISSEQS